MTRKLMSLREKFDQSLQRSAKSQNFKIITGITVVALFIMSTLFFQNAAQALKHLVSEGYTGYYNNAYYATNAEAVSAGLTYVTTGKPTAPASLSCSVSSSNVVTCTFTASTTTTAGDSLDNFSAYYLVYGTSSGLTTSSSSANGYITSGTRTTQGSGTQTYVLAGLSCGNTYYLGVYTSDDLSNTSSVAETSAAMNSCGSGGGGGGGGGADTGTAVPATPATPAVPAVPAVPAAPVVPAVPGVAPDINAGTTPNVPAAGHIAERENTASQMMETCKNGLNDHPSAGDIKLVVAYGLGGTSFGAGENAAIVCEYVEQFKLQKKELKPECEFADISKLMHGLVPTCNKVKEADWNKALSEYKKIYKRDAGTCGGGVIDEWDRRAVSSWAAGWRHARKLKDEAAAVTTFVKVNKKEPKSASDWRGVKAIAYSGSSRECKSTAFQEERLSLIKDGKIADWVKKWTAALLGGL